MRDRVVLRQKGDVSHYAGLMLCGSVWACPDCSARIRAVRADDIGRAVEQHIETGGSAWLITLTARHSLGQPLGPMLDTVVAGFRRLLSGRVAQREKLALGVTGVIRSLEVTYGAAGWHPHVHCVLLFNGTPDPVAFARAVDRWQRSWSEYLAVRGYAPSRARGVQWEPVISGQAAGEYLAKVQDGSAIGLEVARGDLKAGRLGSLHPFEILDYFALTGDLDAVELWREYENATHGRRAITWSPGMRRRLLPDAERSDEDIAADEVGGEDVLVFAGADWDRIVELGLQAEILDVVENAEPAHRFAAVVELLAPHGITPIRPDG